MVRPCYMDGSSLPFFSVTDRVWSMWFPFIYFRRGSSNWNKWPYNYRWLFSMCLDLSLVRSQRLHQCRPIEPWISNPYELDQSQRVINEFRFECVSHLNKQLKIWFEPFFFLVTINIRMHFRCEQTLNHQVTGMNLFYNNNLWSVFILKPSLICHSSFNLHFTIYTMQFFPIDATILRYEYILRYIFPHFIHNNNQFYV